MPQKPANRLYVHEFLTSGAELRLDEERSHYVGRVLRLRVGDEVTLFNGRGGEFSATIDEVSKHRIVLRIGSHCDRDVESPLRINLVQGISRGERMDFVVQKATELGAHRITPVMTGRTGVRLANDKRERRAVHWTKVAQSACEQCGRNVLPIVDSPQSFDQWLNNGAPGDAQRVVLQPGASKPLASVGPAGPGYALLVGPEGGLSDVELEQAAAAGFVACSLGSRVLRTETAAIAALAILQTVHGDLR